MPSGCHQSKNRNASVDADCKRITWTQKSACAEYTAGKDCCILKKHVLETN